MKYILEIKPEYEDSFKGVMILGAKDSNLFVDTLAVENLEQYTPVDIEKIYDKASTDGYNRGLKDGKAQSELGCDGCKYEWVEKDEEPCAHCANCYINHWTAKDDKIEVGDEVDVYGNKGVVTYMCEKVDMYCVMMRDGSAGMNWKKDDLKRTGRHFDIASILEEMRHD